uniref:glycogenin glucosyltransferase n=1 Tax=Timema poppense TaxID=170557 RepID=A0A7R9H4D7_TIMPO|nr:unnamed protein product [Timema poppensis]
MDVSALIDYVGSIKLRKNTIAQLLACLPTELRAPGGDQGLLNQFFSDWASQDIGRHLPFIYNMCSSATYSYLPAYKQFGELVKIVHFIGPNKPWLLHFDTETRQVRPPPGVEHLHTLLQIWWDFFCDNVHPTLSPTMDGPGDLRGSRPVCPSKLGPGVLNSSREIKMGGGIPIAPTHPSRRRVRGLDEEGIHLALGGGGAEKTPKGGGGLRNTKTHQGNEKKF